MDKVTILGGSGMLGSMLVDVFSHASDVSVTATVRSEPTRQAFQERCENVEWCLYNACSDRKLTLRNAVRGSQWVINAIGITKPYAHDDNPAEVRRAIDINSVMPFELADAASEGGARVLQIATDCVWSGRRGLYSEYDPHDALDVYGKTKSLGEVKLPGVTHIRCSIIGPEPKNYAFLLEWFRRQPFGAKVNGFTNHLWNGVTTLHFARVCLGIVQRKLDLPCLQHLVPADLVSKYDLLRCFSAGLNRSDLTIERSEAGTIVDRTLATANESANRESWAAGGYDSPPTISQMVSELAAYEYRFGDVAT